MRRWAFFQRYDIRGPDGSLYMRRLRLIQTPWFAVYLHKIVRPDADRELHDHPWDFVSLILRGGYIEETEGRGPGFTYRQKVWRKPFRLVRHKAEDFHRIDALSDVPAWTLVFCGRRRREWGFKTDKGWVRWDQYLARKEAA